jgi:hypothetical protein
VFDFSIYTGEKVGDQTLLSSEAIVHHLLTGYESDGHILYLDNWYSSPDLYFRLKNGKTNRVGTVRPNRKNMPVQMKGKKKVKRGSASCLYSHGLMAIQWMDRKLVTVISNHHKDLSMTATGKTDRKTRLPIVKPQAIIDYNKCMGGVDRQDQSLASFPIMRRYVKGYKKNFYYIADMAMFNAYQIYKKKFQVDLHYNEFRVNVAEQILERVTLPAHATGRRSTGVTPMRLQAKNWGHFPSLIASTVGGKKYKTRQCKVCKEQKKGRKECRWECEKCKIALHVPECFKLFHTKIDYSVG